MLFFWWKKYESSWIATQISFIGTLLVTVGAIGLAAFSGTQAERLINNGAFRDVIAVIIFGAVFITLQILLNKLTDKIATRI